MDCLRKLNHNKKASELPGKHSACTGLQHDADIKNDAETQDDTEEIPDKPDVSTRLAPDKPDTSTVQASDKPRKGDCQHPLNPESFNLNPDTTGLHPVEGAQARATHTIDPPVDGFPSSGLATTPTAEPAKPKKPDRSHGKRTERATQGSRLPEDWQLPKTWGDWALQERPDLSVDDVRREAACFADYWRAKAGKDARKADWEAIWRIWIRRVNPKNQHTSALVRASPPVHAHAHHHASEDWIRPASLQAKEIARKNLFPEVIDATT